MLFIRSFFSIFILSLGLGSFEARAEVPRKPPLSRYAVLWTNSSFTTKPPVEGPVKGPNPLDDWLLGGISKVGGGYLVILFNRKDPADTRIVEPGESAEFEVLDIRQDPNDYLQTQVQLRHQGNTGWVRYDQAQLALKPPPQQAAPQPPQPGATNGNTPSKPQTQNRRRPRARVVQPPKPR